MLPVLNTLGRSIKGILKHMTYELKQSPENKPSILKENLFNLRTEIDEIAKYHFFLFNFKARFSHLYKYDFDSKEYENLVKSSSYLSEVLDQIYNGLIGSKESTEDFQQCVDKHLDHLTDFINTIRDELK